MPQNNPAHCIDINLLQACPERTYSKGCKTGRDPGLPESCWGTYMPGDEPGNYCGISGQNCEEGCMTYGDCPREDWEVEEGEEWADMLAEERSANSHYQAVDAVKGYGKP